MAAGCEGGSWDGVEDFWNLPRYYSMVDHWREFGPPVYISVAAFVGTSKPGAKKKFSGTEDGESDESKYGNLEELAAMFPGGSING